MPPQFPRPLNFNLPPEFAGNPDIQGIGPSQGPMRQVSGWGQQFSVPGGPPSQRELELQAAGIMNPSGVTDSNPAAVAMASKTANTGLNFNLSPEFANNPNISVGPAGGNTMGDMNAVAASGQTPRLPMEIMPGGNSNGPAEFAIESTPPIADFDPSGGAMGDMNAVAASGGGTLGGQAPAAAKTDWGGLIQSGLSAAKGIAGAADGQQVGGSEPKFTAPAVGMGMTPDIQAQAPTQMGPGIASAGGGQDRMGRIKGLISTLLGGADPRGRMGVR